VPLELAEVAAGLPLAASFAAVGGIATLREGRRRTALNEAMHELRRPLQALWLALPAHSPKAGAAESSLQLAVAALERLDLEINGQRALAVHAPLRLRPLAESAVARWRAKAIVRGRRLDLRWHAAEPLLEGSETDLAQALDNLINNALEHGGVEITLEAREAKGWIHLAVRDRGLPGRGREGWSSSGTARSRLDLWRRLTGRRRRGHGLRVVERVAADHGGGFRLRPAGDGAEALLKLPLRGAIR
jgi:signal transduction histidine kinase